MQVEKTLILSDYLKAVRKNKRHETFIQQTVSIPHDADLHGKRVYHGIDIMQ